MLHPGADCIWTQNRDQFGLRKTVYQDANGRLRVITGDSVTFIALSNRKQKMKNSHLKSKRKAIFSQICWIATFSELTESKYGGINDLVRRPRRRTGMD